MCIIYSCGIGLHLLMFCNILIFPISCDTWNRVSDFKHFKPKAPGDHCMFIKETLETVVIFNFNFVIYLFTYLKRMIICFYRQDAGTGQSRLVQGIFTIFPAFGIILPNGHQTITVDCVAEQQQGHFEEVRVIIINNSVVWTF